MTRKEFEDELAFRNDPKAKAWLERLDKEHRAEDALEDRQLKERVAWSRAEKLGIRVETFDCLMKRQEEERYNLHLSTLPPELAQKKSREKAHKKTTTLGGLALSADGLVGEVVRWICDTSRRPSPELALGTAVTVSPGDREGHPRRAGEGRRGHAQDSRPLRRRHRHRPKDQGGDGG
jgi:hypothetical protein